ncbi:MAG TPA: universal stress protein [Candidatus Methylomirabilis sp.]|jgi:nucleotide-binding universal stress UspA family protein
MNRQGRVLAGLALIGVGVLALDHPALAAALLVAAGFGALVLAIRRRAGGAQAITDTPLAPHRFGRILVPMDSSAEAARALDYARTLAERFGGQVFVLHVLPPPRGLSGRWSVEEGRGARWRARVTMQAFLGGAGAGCLAVSATGTPSAAILEEARRLGADLIVLGLRGTGDGEATVLGRTEAQVVRRAPVPVLTVAGAPVAASRVSAAADAAHPTVDGRRSTVDRAAA